MLIRLKILSTTIFSSVVLLIFLCLGSQNLNKRHKINLILNTTAPLPTGFIVGVSFTLGFIGGGLTSAVLATEKDSFS